MEDDTFRWPVPPQTNINRENLMLRIDFFESSVRIIDMDESADISRVKFVSAQDIAKALTRDLSLGTPLLKPQVIRWMNCAHGETYYLWDEPRIRRIALKQHFDKPAKRYLIPTPGLIFLCSIGKSPMVYAAKRRPTNMKDLVYRAPFANVFDNGGVCAGSHKWPIDPYQIPDSFFTSFFSPTANLENRSVKFPHNIIQMWEYLHKNKVQKYPLSDLVQHGTMIDLKME